MLRPRLLWMSAIVVLLFACDGGASKEDAAPVDPEGAMPGDCTDAADNDQDGLFDCEDDGCFGSPDCTSDGGGDEEGRQALEAVLQVVEGSCTACHGDVSPSAGLDLSPESFCESVLDGRLVIPGNSAGSVLLQRIEGDPSPMPPTGILDEDSIERVALWIDTGAYCEGGVGGGEDGGDDGTTGDPDGASVFATSCAGCHGANGEGLSGPAMTTAVAGRSAADIADIALNGSGGMPAIGVDVDEAHAVGAFCVSEFGG